MRYIFFDTETTGVPKNYKAPSTDTDNWPRLVQLGWILADGPDVVVHTGNLIIRPDGFEIPEEAANVHGIHTADALEKGIPLADAINQFIEDLNQADLIVGHNVGFDLKIVGAEMVRLGIGDMMESKPHFDTMQASTSYCAIPGKFGYKWPKLMELHQKLFECGFEDAHDAMADITATARCFWEMMKRGLA